VLNPILFEKSEKRGQAPFLKGEGQSLSEFQEEGLGTNHLASTLTRTDHDLL